MPILPVKRAVGVPIRKTKDRIQKRFSRTEGTWIGNPNRVGGTQHQGKEKNPQHPEAGGPHNHRKREMEEEKWNQKGEGGENREKQREKRISIGQKRDRAGSDGGISIWGSEFVEGKGKGREFWFLRVNGGLMDGWMDGWKVGGAKLKITKAVRTAHCLLWEGPLWSVWTRSRSSPSPLLSLPLQIIFP